MANLNHVKVAIPLGLGIVSALALHQSAMVDHGTAHATVSTSQQARIKQMVAENGPVNGPVLYQTAADPQRIMPPLLFR